MYEIVLQKKARNDLKMLIQKKAWVRKANELIKIMQANPFQSPPSYEKLSGDLEGKYSRRINIQHRIVYEVCEEKKIVKILSLWSHYEF